MYGLIIGLGATLALASCDVEPVALPIQDVQVDPNVPDSYMRGMPAKLGTPSQNIVMLPWAELNNTWIYNTNPNCDSSIIWNDEICEVRRGNLFREDDSTTFIKATDIVSAGGAPEEITTAGTEIGVKKLISTSIGGNDDLDIGSTSLNNTPLGIPTLRWDNGYTMLHALGLGANSTYLTSLAQASQLGSRVWSIFWGRMWSNNNIDGSLVLGGYDSEKVTGKNFTQRLDYSESTGCWTGMKVTVTDVQVNFRDGSDKSIMPLNTALQCCIVPHRHLLWEAPGTFVDAFENVTNSKDTGVSFGLHWSARTFAAGDAFDGDLTFYLSSGLQVRVPNNQYIVPYVDIERNGSRSISKSTKELLISGLSDQPATLGRYFLTAAYLMVDHDSETFTMWQANPTTRSSLVKVTSDKSNCGKPQTSRVAVFPTSTATSGSDASGGSSSSGDQSGLSTGAIAGIAVGGVAGLAAVGLGIFCFLRAKKRKAVPSMPPPYNPEYTTAMAQEAWPKYGHTQGTSYEVQGSQGYQASELRGQDHFVYEMDEGNSQRR
ncbi:hypothetical protein COL26b_010065 [Colletotrichum chrysophilum]|uniref:uncharacterized protein n=1 Tax=Colletotrichum chrysophilum TaxID=1836956 RepID=UPI0023006455|nr:uncharacterized protein COL26b_010065 [Colletotrichum chrysophilum]KAJ0370495.1 hypothetical protein COL26b_010065 [Colletotrichum chrysophilum]